MTFAFCIHVIVLQHSGAVICQPLCHSNYCKVSFLIGYILYSHPNVMLEAYAFDGWSALFFIIVLVITLYLLTNVVCTTSCKLQYAHHKYMCVNEISFCTGGSEVGHL